MQANPIRLIYKFIAVFRTGTPRIVAGTGECTIYYLQYRNAGSAILMRLNERVSFNIHRIHYYSPVPRCYECPVQLYSSPCKKQWDKIGTVYLSSLFSIGVT